MATAATMTKIAYPEMKKAGYPDDAATGIVAAGGTLGILIPPPVVLAVYGFITEQDIGILFIAGIGPGILAVLMYMATVPALVRQQAAGGEPFPSAKPWAPSRASGPWAFLFVAVIVSIYFGIVTATEAAAAGAFLTALIGLARGKLGLTTLLDSLVEALRTSRRHLHRADRRHALRLLPCCHSSAAGSDAVPAGARRGQYGTLLLIMLMFLVMGCFLDAMAMIILMVPIVFPVILELGFGPDLVRRHHRDDLELGAHHPARGDERVRHQLDRPEGIAANDLPGRPAFVAVDVSGCCC